MPYLHVAMHMRNLDIMAQMDKDEEDKRNAKAKLQARQENRLNQMMGRWNSTMPAIMMNTTNFESNMRRIQGQVGRQIHRAVIDGGNKLITITYKDTPYDKGALRTGGRVTIIGSGNDMSQGLVQYDALAPHNFFNYARKQHDENLNHPKGGKDHYLSDNVDSKASLIVETMTRTVRQVL